MLNCKPCSITHTSTGWSVYFGGEGLVLSPVKSYAVPEMNLYNIFVRNEGQIH